MQFSIDDLPAPLGPMMARISPLAMSKLMSESAFTPPNDRLMFSTASRTSLKERERVMALPGARHSAALFLFLATVHERHGVARSQQ
jgi:hypothetical protein